ncbi:MAG TPA: type II toxin-antitoxin system CcdA family antitoxin [Streptosporangiaceae bacterium]|nr:type II toxin-antitoxin system CcdA family antitoxin [Streptosporangiaceae bacterium]
MTHEPKRKISVTLDSDLVAAVEADGAENLSARVNAALRADLDSRRRRRALGELLDKLAGERGPLDSAADEAEIARFMRLLGGLPDDSAGSLRAS